MFDAAVRFTAWHAVSDKSPRRLPRQRWGGARAPSRPQRIPRDGEPRRHPNERQPVRHLPSVCAEHRHRPPPHRRHGVAGGVPPPIHRRRARRVGACQPTHAPQQRRRTHDPPQQGGADERVGRHAARWARTAAESADVAAAAATAATHWRAAATAGGIAGATAGAGGGGAPPTASGGRRNRRRPLFVRPCGASRLHSDERGGRQPYGGQFGGLDEQVDVHRRVFVVVVIFPHHPPVGAAQGHKAYYLDRQRGSLGRLRRWENAESMDWSQQHLHDGLRDRLCTCSLDTAFYWSTRPELSENVSRSVRGETLSPCGCDPPPRGGGGSTFLHGRSASLPLPFLCSMPDPQRASDSCQAIPDRSCAHAPPLSQSVLLCRAAPSAGAGPVRYSVARCSGSCPCARHGRSQAATLIVLFGVAGCPQGQKVARGQPVEQNRREGGPAHP